MSMSRNHPPQAFISSFAPRLRNYSNALLQPIQPPANQLPNVRTTKRGTTSINYAEDGFDEDFEDSDDRRRPTGLRSLRRAQESQDVVPKQRELGEEAFEPVEVQGIWREWMGKPGKLVTEKQQQIQCVLPLHLVPIRIDVDIQSFRPDAPLPAPQNPQQYGIDDTLPIYRPGEPTPSFRLKDAFLWNLHEALITPDQFAKRMVEELDFPAYQRMKLIAEITTQIRKQLEEHAEFALHPLFQPAAVPTPHHQQPTLPNTTNGTPTRTSQNTPIPHTATANGHIPSPRPNGTPVHPSSSVTATATLPSKSEPQEDKTRNPDDTYRIILTLSVNLLNKLYTDKFEWSLIHPPGAAETFARLTCADLGLPAEWSMAIAHAIYEAVLRLRRDIVENGGLAQGQGYAGELHNEAAYDRTAGWRVDVAPEGLLCEGWEPRVEVLTREEIEKREGDRERQLRRARRETARFTTGVMAYAGTSAGGGGGGLFDQFTDPTESERMGRGERRKTKRRFRSISPEGTPDTGSAGGFGKLDEMERPHYRCTHCGLWGSAIWGVRDGPTGSRKLCQNCGFLWERDRRLPVWSKDFFREGGGASVPASGGATRR